ncbi:hypothetical protein [Alkalihalobacillus sp. BA299]|uniref:hypothetical protein n=1 Tax=Alkalihalobacillus sp. BA299 TaxID=2815938 RepID=UPI001ADB87A1|nr:hypothetical protein [Alkalihalobacillus sp. BA299]
MGMVLSDYIFRKTYFLADDNTVVEFFSLIEERRTIFKNNPKENRFTAITLKTDLREIPIDNFDVSFVEKLMNEDEIVEKYRVTKEKKDKLLQYNSLFEAKASDYPKNLN